MRQIKYAPAWLRTNKNRSFECQVLYAESLRNRLESNIALQWYARVSLTAIASKSPKTARNERIETTTKTLILSRNDTRWVLWPINHLQASTHRYTGDLLSSIFHCKTCRLTCRHDFANLKWILWKLAVGRILPLNDSGRARLGLDRGYTATRRATPWVVVVSQ